MRGPGAIVDDLRDVAPKVEAAREREAITAELEAPSGGAGSVRASRGEASQAAPEDGREGHGGALDGAPGAAREPASVEPRPDRPMAPHGGRGAAGGGGSGYVVESGAVAPGGGGVGRGEGGNDASRAFLLDLLGDLAEVDGDNWRQHLTTGRKGSIESTLGNVFLILRHDRRVLSARPRFNELTLFAEVGAHIVDDASLTAIRAKVERHWGFSPAEDATAKALGLAARLDAYHPVREYLSGLRWDGIPRITRLACDLFGAPSSRPLYGRFVWCFFGGAVGRVFEPGCLHQSVLALVGDQGLLKSQFFKCLGGAWFNESKIEVGEKDGAMKTHAAWIHEFPEVEQITLFRECAAVKAFITTSSDTFRAPYERTTRTVPRSSIFGATTNQDDFLRDESGTGSRRWHPIQVRRPVNVAWLLENRDQLWAEAVVRWRARELTYLTREEEAEREKLAGEFYQLDPWEGAITRWLATAPEVQLLPALERYFVTSGDIFGGALGFRRSDPGVGEARRLGGLMRRLGWERKKERVAYGSATARRLSEPEWGYAAPVGWVPPSGELPPSGIDFPSA